MAADPGMVEKIAGFLNDNALTRSWQESMSNWVRNPVEDMLVKDVEVSRLQDMMAFALTKEGQLKPELVTALRQRLGDEEAGVILNGKKPVEVQKQLSGDGVVEYLADLSPEDRLAIARSLRVPSYGLTEAGSVAADILGHPVAAYSAVSAGGAMGLAAALAAYEQLMGKPQAAEDKPVVVVGK